LHETHDNSRAISDPALRQILINASSFLLDLKAGLGYSHIIPHRPQGSPRTDPIDAMRPTHATGEEADAMPELRV
jgi:hypothetical protein